MNKSVIIIAVAVAVAAGSILYATSWNSNNGEQIRTEPEPVTGTTDSKTDTLSKTDSIGSIIESLNGAELGKFTTFSEYAEFIDELDKRDRDGQSQHPRVEFSRRQAESSRFQTTASQVFSNPYTHSTTNVQVQGVDEADFVKNDGRYIYALKHNILSIVDTQMITESSAFLTALDIPPLVQKYDMLVNGDRLIVLYYITHYSQVGRVQDYTTHALVLDIADKSAVEQVMEYSVAGMIHTGRMIGDHVYTTSSKIPDAENPIKPVLRLDQEVIQDTPIYFLDDINLPSLNTIMAFDVNGGSSNSLAIVMDYTATVFMSEDNMYIASFKDDSDTTVSTNLALKLLEPILESYPDNGKSELVAELQEIDLKDWDAFELALDLIDDAFDQLPTSMHENAEVESGLEQLDFIEVIVDTRDITSIYKIAMGGSDFELAARGAVPGILLNRFAMDELDGNLRMATTTYRSGEAFSNVFVLDEKLVEVGALVGIGLDEEFYSTRFVGDKLYMVTFQHIDPFFVIDLSADSPKIEGKVELPGYSVYLHFYDKDTIIGIGRDEGVKVEVFDISNMKHPRLADSVIIGSRSTPVPVEFDHRVALIDRSKSLFVIPIIIYETNTTRSTDTSSDADRIGSLVFMVFDLTRTDLELVHTVSHSIGQDVDKSYARSFYIGDDLYTVSERAVAKSPLSEPFDTLKIPIGPS